MKLRSTLILFTACALAACQTASSNQAPATASKPSSTQTDSAKLKPTKKSDPLAATWSTREDVVIGKRTIEFAVSPQRNYVLAREA